MELRFQNPTVYVVHDKQKQFWKWNLYTVLIFLRKTESVIYRYKINNNVELLKSKVSRNVGNSSEDSVFNFILVWLIEVGNFWKIWRSSGTFSFDILENLKIVFNYSVLKWD